MAYSLRPVAAPPVPIGPHPLAWYPIRYLIRYLMSLMLAHRVPDAPFIGYLISGEACCLSGLRVPWRVPLLCLSVSVADRQGLARPCKIQSLQGVSPLANRLWPEGVDMAWTRLAIGPPPRMGSATGIKL